MGALHWKLDFEEGKVLQADDDNLAGNSFDHDPLLNILTNKRIENGQWLVDGSSECVSCKENREDQNIENDR